MGRLTTHVLDTMKGGPAAGVALTLDRLHPDGPTWMGLSSHNLDPRLPIAAVARGAKMIEMHVMLDDEPSALESNVSLTVSDFARMVRDVRATEEMLG